MSLKLLKNTRNYKQCQNVQKTFTTPSRPLQRRRRRFCDAVWFDRERKSARVHSPQPLRPKGRIFGTKKCLKILLVLKSGLFFILSRLDFAKNDGFQRYLANILTECNAPDLVSPSASLVPARERRRPSALRGLKFATSRLQFCICAVEPSFGLRKSTVANYCKLHVNLKVAFKCQVKTSLAFCAGETCLWRMELDDARLRVKMHWLRMRRMKNLMH